jgi:uncharacterized protein with PQ loop repeat
MNNFTNYETNHQEYFGWIGNGIFIIAQYAQILHTYKVKKTDDVSYILEIMWIIGNGMYTVFGYIDNSMSMFCGNLTSLILSLIQLSQKIYYDRINGENRLLLGSISSRTYSEIN